MVVVKLWPCPMPSHGTRKPRFKSETKLLTHLWEKHPKGVLAAQFAKRVGPDLVGAPTLAEAKAQMVDRLHLLDKEQLRAIDIRTLRALKSAVCSNSCDQLGGYHSGGCKQLRTERERRENLAAAQKAGASFYRICPDCGYVDGNECLPLNYQTFLHENAMLSGDDILRLGRACKGHRHEEFMANLPPEVLATRFVFPDTEVE